MRTGTPEPDPTAEDGGPNPVSRWWWVGLAAIVVVGFVLRIWGIRWGLPYAYNLDERSHFVPRAVEYFRGSSLDPDYQLNPSGLIEWIAAALLVTRGSASGVVDAWNDDPSSIWTVARVASALLSTTAIGLLYAAGSRLFDRRVGLLAAAILATAFLPVHYGHLALNDGPSLALIALVLFAVAGVVRFGRRRDYVLAGLGLGAAVGFKYNSGFVLLPLLTAAAIHALGWRPGDLRRDTAGVASDGATDASAAGTDAGAGAAGAGAAGSDAGAGAADANAAGSDHNDRAAEPGEPAAARAPFRLPHWRPALLGLVLAAVAGAVAFFVCDPYAVLRPGFFRSEVEHLSNYTSGGLLLGETERSGYRYYLWSLLWGFGLLPLVLTAVGGVRLLVRDRWQALVLIPAPVIFLLAIGGQGRYFARYGMPIYPLLAVIAAAGGVWIGGWLLTRIRARGGVRVALALTLGAAVLAQGIVLSVHNNRVLSRTDTRTLARDWMVQNIPPRTTIVVEPLVPREWYVDGATVAGRHSRAGYRWERLVRHGDDKAALIREFPQYKGKIQRAADFANYGLTLFPEMLDFYRRKGACWIVSGSLQSGRVFNNPGRVPAAVAYYRALERESDLKFAASPFDRDDDQHYFQYDLAFNFAPLRFHRPGPAVRIHRLRDCEDVKQPRERD